MHYSGTECRITCVHSYWFVQCWQVPQQACHFVTRWCCTKFQMHCESTRLTEWCLCTVSPRGWPSGVCAPSVHVVDRVVFVHRQSTWSTEWCLCTVSLRGRPSGVCALSVHVVDRVGFVHCQSTWSTEWCLCTVSPRIWPSGVCAPSVHVVDRVVFVHCQSTWLNKWCLCTVSPCGWPDAFHSLCVLCQLLAGWSSRMAWHTTSAENSSRSRIMIVAMSKVCLKVNGLNSGWVVNVCKENVY